MEQYKILMAERDRLEALIKNSNPNTNLFITKMKLNVVNGAMYSYEREIMDELKVTYLRQLISPDSLADAVLLEEEKEG